MGEPKRKRSIREKIVELFRDATDGAIEPRKIVVLPKRSSGPRETPPDWYLEEVNKLLPKRDESERDLPPAA